MNRCCYHKHDSSKRNMMIIPVRGRPHLLEYAGSCASSINEWHPWHSAMQITKISCMGLSLIVFTHSSPSPFKAILIWGNTKNSYEAVQYGIWRTRGMWFLAKYFCTIWAECAATVSRLIYYAQCWLWIGRVRAMASVVILSNNNVGLRFSLVQCIHGAQYLLNLVLILESYSYREMRHNSFYRTKSLHTLIYIM